MCSCLLCMHKYTYKHTHTDNSIPWNKIFCCIAMRNVFTLMQKFSQVTYWEAAIEAVDRLCSLPFVSQYLHHTKYAARKKRRALHSNVGTVEESIHTISKTHALYERIDQTRPTDKALAVCVLQTRKRSYFVPSRYSRFHAMLWTDSSIHIIAYKL